MNSGRCQFIPKTAVNTKAQRHSAAEPQLTPSLPSDGGEKGKAPYKTGGNRLGRFPEAASDDLLAAPKRNFQIFDPLDFLAEVTQQIPKQGEHLIRYYGW